MNEKEWYERLHDRHRTYTDRLLDQDRWITIRATQAYASTYAGQVAILTAANLLGRMSRSVALEIPIQKILAPLPWEGVDLLDYLLEQMKAADPMGRFNPRKFHQDDYLFQLGETGAETVVHGIGWDSYVGPSPSPLPYDAPANPVGAAFAVVLAVADLCFHQFDPPQRNVLFDTLHWRPGKCPDSSPAPQPRANIGHLWTVGAGSVGSAILYFLSLFTRKFHPALFDGDLLKIENITRSPIFLEKYLGWPKVEAVADFLKNAGLNEVLYEGEFLHSSSFWKARQDGEPDILVSAANEYNVRFRIEAEYPPIQIYGTTGKSWQASLIRHEPFMDACSCCLFPESEIQADTLCATGKSPGEPAEKGNDAALPFLSFAAGLMAAAEILKTSLPGYPFSRNRVTLNTWGEPRLMANRIPKRDGCICSSRSEVIHRRMVEGIP